MSFDFGIFLQIIFRSLETGGVYALSALGIIIIYRTSNMTNFAQGVLGMFNTFTAAYLYNKFSLPLAVCVLASVITAVICGFLIDFIVIRRTTNIPPVGKQIITLGFIMVFLGATPLIFGVDPLKLPRFINSGDISIGTASISHNALLNIGIGLAVMFGLFYFLQKTKWGLAVRTTASNEPIARLMGVPTKTVTLGAWAVAAILGTLAGIMIAPTTTVSVGFMDNVQVNALLACILGGFQTFYGAVIGAFIIGIGRNLLLVYVSQTWGEQILYLLILLVLVFMPYGILGKKTVKKV